MFTKKLGFAMVCAAAVATGAAQGATITAVPDAGSDLRPGDIVTVSLIADFTTESILGGGFDVFYDNGHLGFVSFSFADVADIGDDAALRRLPDVLPGELNGIGFGNFDGLGGLFEIATVQFEILAAGTSLIDLAVNEGGPPSNPGGFYDAAGLPLQVSFTGAQVTSVPLPAAVWLFAAGVVTLAGFTRRC